VRRRNGIAILLFLTALLPPALRASDFKLVFSLGAHARDLSGYSYDYALRVNQGNAGHPPEYGTGNDRPGKGAVFGPDFGLGLSYKNISLVLSFIPFSGKFDGTYDLSIPSMWFYNLIAADSIRAGSRFTGSSLGAGLKYALPLGRAVRIFVGAGAHLLWGELELPQDFVFMEYFYRSPDLSFGIHTVDITSVVFTPVAVKTLGWNALGGLEFSPAPSYWVFLETRYQTGRLDVAHPYYSRLNPTLPPVHLDFSGFSLSLGIRYALNP
jgi:hypothetical protein